MLLRCLHGHAVLLRLLGSVREIAPEDLGNFFLRPSVFEFANAQSVYQGARNGPPEKRRPYGQVDGEGTLTLILILTLALTLTLTLTPDPNPKDRDQLELVLVERERGLNNIGMVDLD
jgi:hypothetical protein